MAHFAKINEQNIVTDVIVVRNEDILDSNDNESEDVGIQFCSRLFGGDWLQTSYNGSFRKNYAGIGFMYDETRDAFIEQKPYDSWILNEDTCRWEAPVLHPDDGSVYTWDEKNINWKAIEPTEE